MFRWTKYGKIRKTQTSKVYHSVRQKTWSLAPLCDNGWVVEGTYKEVKCNVTRLADQSKRPVDYHCHQHIVYKTDWKADIKPKRNLTLWVKHRDVDADAPMNVLQ